jgi:hypothetical protein
MSLNHPSLVTRTHDLERDLMLARAAVRRDSRPASSVRGTRGAAALGARRLGAAFVALGLRLQGPSSAAGVLPLSGEQSAGA